MGLKEKRAIKEVEDSLFPGIKDQICSILGYEPEINVHWEQLAEDGKDHLYATSIPKVYFEPLTGALQEICADDMGKEAIAGLLKKIVIKNEGEIWSASQWVSLEGDTLILNHQTCTNVDNIADRKKSLLTLLEKSL
ncbi:MAG: hypothetical protein H6622_06405 [Halobacteriovoraceae bacterium]|nr:hypothetical protein [Halobacteriovoraceae bacterium]